MTRISLKDGRRTLLLATVLPDNIQMNQSLEFNLVSEMRRMLELSDSPEHLSLVIEGDERTENFPEIHGSGYESIERTVRHIERLRSALDLLLSESIPEGTTGGNLQEVKKGLLESIEAATRRVTKMKENR